MLGLSALNRLTTLAVSSQLPDKVTYKGNINYMTQQDSLMLGLLALNRLTTLAVGSQLPDKVTYGLRWLSAINRLTM